MPTDTANTPSPPPHREQPGNRFFDWMRGLGIVRQPGWIGGVCAGVAARLGIDAVIVRGIVVVLAIFGGPALLLYAAAWLLLPDSEDRIHLERLFRGQFTPPVIAVGVLVLLAFLPLGGLWFAGPAFWGGPLSWGGSAGHILWTLAVIGAIVWFVIWATRRSRGDTWPTAASPTTPSPATTASFATPIDAQPGAVPEPDAPTPPPAPDAADTDALAAWKVQQANWKREHDAWKAAQAESQRVIAHERAAEARRARQEQNAERQREWAERNRRTRSNPLYSLMAIGLSLVAGAAVALALSVSGWSVDAAITGMAVTLAVLGLAIVVNGFRGRRSGGSSGVAVMVAIALIVTSVFSWASGTISSGALNWTPSYSADQSVQRTVIRGAVTVDLTDYFADSASDVSGDFGRVGMRVVDGPVNVILPADEFSYVRANAVTGEVRLTDPSKGTWDDSTDRYVFEPSGQPAHEPAVLVTIWAVNGDITLTQAEQ
jgi:phage shock protein PspC (stress-responsive transcriptional regulator)